MTQTVMPRRLHEAALAAMKRLLDLGELAFSSGGGRESGAFRNYKFQVMQHIADMEREQFAILSDIGHVEPCECGDSLVGGPRWTRCELCAGSGFKPTGGKKE